MKLKEYLSEFYNNKFIRDFTFLKTDPNAKYQDQPYLDPNNKEDYNKTIKNFVFKNVNKPKTFGYVAGQTAYYKHIADLRNKSRTNMYLSEIAFDFDVKDNILDAIKSNISYSFIYRGNERLSRIKKYQKEYQDIIFGSDVLRPAFDDMMRLYEYFKQRQIKPYVKFSGSKGFHLHIFFNEVKLNNPAQLVHNLSMNLKNGLGLDTLDEAVAGDFGARKMRAPYGKHVVSDLFTIPFDPADTMEDVLESSRKRNIADFCRDDYVITDPDFLAAAIKSDQDYDEAILNQRLLNKAINKRKYRGERVEDITDMREIARKVLKDPAHVYEHYDYYYCPFHEDNTPSAQVSKERFLCKSEGLSLGVDGFLRKYYHLKSNAEVSKLKRELMRK